MNRADDDKQLDDFSLVLGGPLYHLFVRAWMVNDTFGLVKRRMVVIALITWLPLLLLSLLPGESSREAIKVPFLYD